MMVVMTIVMMMVMIVVGDGDCGGHDGDDSGCDVDGNDRVLARSKRKSVFT
jgi:hypothetical protein